MALAANSYGSVEEVAAMVPNYTASGEFSTSTRPTEHQVEVFIDRVSAIINAVLARQGFSIPITNADAKLACDEFVVEQVVDLCDAVNRMGRFYSDSVGGQSRFALIRRDAVEFIEDQATGLEQLGATRNYSLTQGLGYLSTDDSGDDIEPIFQREMMRQTIVDWDDD